MSNWGGGPFSVGVYDKTIPGSYINITVNPNLSVTETNRGVVAIPVELVWGTDNEVMTVTKDEYINNCRNIFGLPLGSEELKLVDEVFQNANKAYFYRLNSNGRKAKGVFGEAKNCGKFGNKITVVVENDPDSDTENFKVNIPAGTTTAATGLSEELSKVNVAFTTDGNTVTATYTDLPTGYTPAYQLKLGTALVATQEGVIDPTETKNSVSLTFSKKAPNKAAYTLVARAKDTSNKYTTLSNYQFNVEHVEDVE